MTAARQTPQDYAGCEYVVVFVADDRQLLTTIPLPCSGGGWHEPVEFIDHLACAGRLYAIEVLE